MQRIGIVCVVLLCFVSFFSCNSISDNVVQAIDEESFNELEELYALILEYRFMGDSNALSEAEDTIDTLINEPTYNKDYRTRLLGLAAVSAFYNNNSSKAQALVEVNSGINDEFKWIAQGLLQENADQRLEILIQSKDSVLNQRYLNTYLAETYIELGEYGKAVALLDEFLLEANDKEKAFYNETREMAFEFMKNAPSDVDNLDILSKAAINFNDAIKLTLEDSSFFDHLIENDDVEAAELLQTLKENKYIFKADTELEKMLLRKDLAFLLFKVIAYITNDNQMIEDLEALYIEDISNQQKEELNGSSPVPDVEIYEYYFYAVIYLVETEIMELPDGENFDPDGTVSGFEYNEIMNKIKEWY